jgi:uncharacterized protein
VTAMASKGHPPIRTCVSCRSAAPKGDLLRIVSTSDGAVRIDPTGKASGRGAYLCGSDKCNQIAIKSGKLAKALRCAIPDELRADLERLQEGKKSAEQGNGN